MKEQDFFENPKQIYNQTKKCVMSEKGDKFYIGLDIGTDSVGFAATDGEYTVLKKRGAHLWGARLFDAAKTAAERRVFRTGRRRSERRAQRVRLLEEIFEEEIGRVDEAFFIRLHESALVREDKTVDGRFSLFNDKSYTDKDYHKKYPTIFHLRKALAEGKKQFDIRLVFLAIRHIIKYRGNFINEGQTYELSDAVKDIFLNINEYLMNEHSDAHVEFEFDKVEKMTDIVLSVVGKKRLQEELTSLFCVEKSAICKAEMIVAISGGKFKLEKLFDDKTYHDENSVSFDDAKFEEEKAGDLRTVLGDSYYLIELLKAVYDWRVLTVLLRGSESVSEAMIKIYEKHKSDLRRLKDWVNAYDREKFFEIFKRVENKKKNPDNYCAYTGTAMAQKKKLYVKRCKQPKDFLKYIKDVLTAYTGEDGKAETAAILAEIGEVGEGMFLPKITSTNNGVIPYQLHYAELKKILTNAAIYLPFLEVPDGDGFTPIEKIESLLTFRIPYYVGPLNAAHAKAYAEESIEKTNQTLVGQRNAGVKKCGNAWAVRKSDGRIVPWMFDKLIDREASADRFIRRMTSKCTYLYGEDVLPKASLIYQKYAVLNQLNKLTVSGNSISVEEKKRLFNELFKNKTKITRHDIGAKFMLTKEEENEIGGIDSRGFTSTLTSYVQFSKTIFCGRDEKEWEDIAEYAIFSHAIFTQEKGIVEDRLKREFPKRLSETELKKIKGLSFTGFGNLSEKFLTGILRPDYNGDPKSIMDLLLETNQNLNEIIDDKSYGFRAEIEKINRESNLTEHDPIEDLNISPSVKRAVRQALAVTDELIEAAGKVPDKIMVEVTRGDDEGKKGKLTNSRKNQIEKLYVNKETVAELRSDELFLLRQRLSEKSNQELRGDRLFFYFMQSGRCAYTGKQIDLDRLQSDSYDIDHIIPKALKKDDSIDNRVLVETNANRKKSADYPLSEEIRKGQARFWRWLKESGYISVEKYERLIRNEPLSEAETEGFIKRQLVFTGQAAKAVSEILKVRYPNTRIVYSKARNVSEFRQKFDLLKCREINDLHHAKDAYLNIVVGNVYDTRYSGRWWLYKDSIQEEIPSVKYPRFDKLFTETDTEGAWISDHGKTIGVIKDVMRRNDCLVAKKVQTEGGMFYDQTVYPKVGEDEKKGVDLVPRNKRLADVTKYGGYKSWKGAYFVLIEYDKEKGGAKNRQTVKERALEQIPIMYKEKLKTDAEIIAYFEGLSYKNIKIIVRKIKIGSLMEIDGALVYLNGRSNSQLTLCNAAEWRASEFAAGYVRRLVKYKGLKTEKILRDDSLSEKNELVLSGSERSKNEPIKLVRTDNGKLFCEIIYELKKPIYHKRLVVVNCKKQDIATALEGKKQDFLDISSVAEQADVLLEMINLLQTKLSTADLRRLGLTEHTGALSTNKKLLGKIVLIETSVTGLYRSRRVLSEE
ncbi:MAG: type II CRISPR RNA-guided endonuclease Cas9 [Clostridiales bacterium]|jgi:CRISPR-associated endonuclease Csn1|nr:type II CRISPR RNA-guided endonuclease Cas9 [Clostridiales bacterium]